MRPMTTEDRLLRRRGFFAVVLGGLAATAGCVPRSERQVVVYCGVDRDFAAPILDAYERANPELEVARQFDVESTKSVGLANRILEEKASPRCDVFWNGEVLQAVRLDRAGLLEPFQPEIADSLLDRFRSDRGTWYCTAARARVLIVNTDLLPDRDHWPKQVADLAGAAWAGRCGIASPLFGSTSTHMTVLAGGGDPFWTWFEQVADNASILSGNKQVAQAVASGELAWGLTDTDDALIERENGRPVDIVLPDQGEDGIGTLLIPYTVAIVRGGPHPIAARHLANYLCSPATAERLTMATAAQFDLTGGAPRSEHFAEAASIKVMEADYAAAVDRWEATIERLRSVLRSE